MDVQSIFVSLIVGGAFVYFGILLARKLRQFKPTSGCGTDCGCGSPDAERS